MAAMFFVGVSATDIYVPSLPEMVHDFHSKPSNINLTLSIFSIGIAIAVLFTGELSNRFGRRKILLSGVAIFCFTSLLMAITENLALMIMYRAFQAVGAATILVVPRLILQDCMSEEEQIRANGMLSISLIISPAVAPVLGAHLAYWFGWRSCFLFTFFIAAVLFGWGYKILPETHDSPIKQFKPLKFYINNYIKLIRNRIFLTLALIYGCAIGAYFTFIGISSYLYIKSWHISPIRYSFIFLCLSIAYLLGNQTMQSLNKRKVKSITIIGLGVYSTLVGIVIILVSALFINSYPTAAVILVSVGVLFMRAANALINPPAQIKVMNYFPEHSAQALGLNLAIGFALNSLGVYLVTIVPAYPFFSFIIISTCYVSVCFWVFIRNARLIEG